MVFLITNCFCVSPFASPGTHLHEPRSAGAFTPGWPYASAGDQKILNAKTLRLGESRDSLVIGRSGTRSPTQLDGYSTPSPSQKREGLNEKQNLNDNQVTPYYERSDPEALFTIRYSLAWEEVLNAMVDNIKAKSLNIEEYYVEDNFGNRYSFQDGGKLDKPPSADLFPIRILPKETHLEDRDASGGTPPPASGPSIVTAGSEAPEETPSVNEFQKNMNETEGPKILETIEPPCPEQTQGEPVEGGGNVERDQVGKSGVKRREMTSQPTAAPAMNAYEDGSYWKKLGSVL